MSSNQEFLVVERLVKHFPITRGVIFQKKVGEVHAVDNISFNIKKGETLGLVGESGCGKSTTGRAILQLQRPTSGHVYYKGVDLVHLQGVELRRMRRSMQIIFQDPYASLNPRMTVGEIIGEVVYVHGLARGNELRERVDALLNRVGLDPAYANRYPHEFSGGQRQRIGVARALAVNPELVVCDEPISALDVSIQAQVVNLLEDLQAEFGLTYLFIAHDLSMIRHISQRVAVMYLGTIVELTTQDELYLHPLHPYTQALLASVPSLEPGEKKQRRTLAGDVPSPLNPPPGCPFHTRCPEVMEICRTEVPATISQGSDHTVGCHLYQIDSPAPR